MSISEKVFNINKSDYKNTPLFLGDSPGLTDSLNKQYPTLWNLYKKMKSLDWDENEFDFSSCARDFKTCDRITYDIMIKTLAWQWETDSVISRSIGPIVAPFVSSSELWAGWQRISDNECLVEGTEVLTPTGWIDLKYVTLQTLVAQYNPTTKEIEFINPTYIVQENYIGPVYDFHNTQEHFRQVVTPRHRMLARKNSTGEIIVEEASSFEYNKGSASDGICGINSGYKTSGRHTELSTIEKILIAIQADGHISERYTGELCGTIPVWFSFSKVRKITRLIDLCLKANINIKELSEDIFNPLFPNVAAQRRFKIDIPIQYLSFLKNFNWVDLIDKTQEWCNDFLYEIIQWDGHFTKNTGILHTTSKQAAEITQAIASISGYKTHLVCVPDNRKETYSDCWRLSWKNVDFTSGQVINKTTDTYNGIIRCLTVPSNFFMIRYNNKVSITGNSIHALTYSEIVRNSFDDPDDVFEEILSVKESISRLETVTSVYADVYIMSHKLALGLVEKDQTTYNSIFMFTVVTYILERLQFVDSFGITFGIAETGLFMPIGKAVQKICQDEFEVHAKFDRAILDIELETLRGKRALVECLPLIKQILTEINATELAWNNYLFPNGHELPGLNKEVMFQWHLYNAKEIYDYFKIECEYEFPTKNPLKFMENWMDISKTQSSPQEEKVGNYMLGMMKENAGDTKFKVDF